MSSSRGGRAHKHGNSSVYTLINSQSAYRGFFREFGLYRTPEHCSIGEAGHTHAALYSYFIASRVT